MGSGDRLQPIPTPEHYYLGAAVSTLRRRYAQTARVAWTDRNTAVAPSKTVANRNVPSSSPNDSKPPAKFSPLRTSNATAAKRLLRLITPQTEAPSRHAPLHPSSPKLLRLGTDAWVFEEDRPARRISYREAARLQGFDGDLIFPETGGLGMRYRVVGNAVPPPLFRAVAGALPNIW